VHRLTKAIESLGAYSATRLTNGVITVRMLEKIQIASSRELALRRMQQLVDCGALRVRKRGGWRIPFFALSNKTQQQHRDFMWNIHRKNSTYLLTLSTPTPGSVGAHSQVTFGPKCTKQADALDKPNNRSRSFSCSFSLRKDPNVLGSDEPLEKQELQQATPAPPQPEPEQAKAPPPVRRVPVRSRAQASLPPPKPAFVAPAWPGERKPQEPPQADAPPLPPSAPVQAFTPPPWTTLPDALEHARKLQESPQPITPPLPLSAPVQAFAPFPWPTHPNAPKHALKPPVARREPQCLANLGDAERVLALASEDSEAARPLVDELFAALFKAKVGQDEVAYGLSSLREKIAKAPPDNRLRYLLGVINRQREKRAGRQMFAEFSTAPVLLNAAFWALEGSDTKKVVQDAGTNRALG
jgi:hypothetical protein